MYCTKFMDVRHWVVLARLNLQHMAAANCTNCTASACYWWSKHKVRFTAAWESHAGHEEVRGKLDGERQALRSLLNNVPETLDVGVSYYLLPK